VKIGPVDPVFAILCAIEIKIEIPKYKLDEFRVEKYTLISQTTPLK